MNNLTINNLKLITTCLLLTFLTTSITNAQVIEEPPEGDTLSHLPIAFNMDNEDIDWAGEYTFWPFEGAELERIENPDKSGINDTEYVLEYIKADGSQPWGGFFYNTEEVMMGTENAVFRLKVWSHIADSMQALVKLEMKDFPDVTTGDIFTYVTVKEEWTQVEWDLSGIDSETPWDRVVIIMDLPGGAGDGSARYTWYLDDFEFDNGESTSNELSDAGIPQSLTLNQNYPNPFNPTTNINFALSQSSHATLQVFNMLGQNVATLVNEPLSAGQHSVSFDASHLTSGVYIYRLQAGDEVKSRKLTLIK